MHTKDTVEPVAVYSALDWQTGWNPAIGLWTSAGPGHTQSVADKPWVHARPEATMRLLVAAATNKLNQIDLPAVFSAVRPPIVGRTCAIQRGGHLLALRIMPSVAAAWDELCDRFRLIGGQSGLQCMQTGERSWQLIMSFPERTVSTHCVILAGVEPALVERSESLCDLEVRLNSGQLQNRRGLVTLWGISLDGAVTEPPVLEPDPDVPRVSRSAEERAWRLRWKWPARTWDVHIDPLASNPLWENKNTKK